MGTDDRDLEVIGIAGALLERVDRKRSCARRFIAITVIALVAVLGSLLWSVARVRDANEKADAAVRAAHSYEVDVIRRFDQQRACMRSWVADAERAYVDSQSGQLLDSERQAELSDLTTGAVRCESLLP